MENEEKSKYCSLMITNLNESQKSEQIVWLRYYYKDINNEDKLENILNNNFPKKHYVKNVGAFFHKPFFNSLYLYNNNRNILKFSILCLIFALIIGYLRSKFQSDIAGAIVITIALLSYFIFRSQHTRRLTLINHNEPIQDHYTFFEQFLVGIFINMIWYLLLIIISS